MNNVSLIGNIATDIDLRSTPNGIAVAKFSLAVTNPYKRDKTSFVPVEVWRKQAENVSSFCSKGSKVGVVGHIEIDSYEKDGQRKSYTKVVAASVEFLTPKNSNTGNISSASSDGGQAPRQTNTHNQSQGTQNRQETAQNEAYDAGQEPNYDDSDLPF